MTGLEDAIRAIVAEEVAAAEQRIMALLPAHADKTLDVREAAKHIGISEKLMYSLCKTNDIPHERYGVSGSRRPTIKIRLSDLEAWRAEQRAKRWGKEQ